MNFMEMINKIKEGDKFRRRYWGDDFYYTFDHCEDFICSKKSQDVWNFDDFIGDDWEIITHDRYVQKVDSFYKVCDKSEATHKLEEL